MYLDLDKSNVISPQILQIMHPLSDWLKNRGISSFIGYKYPVSNTLVLIPGISLPKTNIGPKNDGIP